MSYSGFYLCCNQHEFDQLEVQPGMSAQAGFDNPMFGAGALQEVVLSISHCILSVTFYSKLIKLW